MNITREPLAYSVDEARVHLGGACRSTDYDLLRAGELQGKKCGRRTLILADSLTSYIANLPDFSPRSRAA